MKNSAVALLLCAFIASAATAQEEPIPPKRSSAVKFGFFGGFTPGWLNVNVGPINEFLTGAGAAPLRNNGVFMFGGAGAAYIMIIPNVRVGGVGMSGSISSTSLDAAGLRRDAKLVVGYGGVTVEYVVPIMDRLDVAAGIMLGTGGMDLTLRESNGGNDSWASEQKYFQSGLTAPPYTITRTLSGSFIVWVPSVYVEYAILGWLGSRVGVSYTGMSAPSWQVDANYDLLGVPSSVSGRGVMINAGVFVGIF